MNLIREECEKAFKEIENATTEITYNEFKNQLNVLNQLINEHFDNPPLKWEEIKEGDFVFDKDFNGLGGEWLKICVKFINGFGEKVLECGACGSGDLQTRTYKDDRFYRKQVE